MRRVYYEHDMVDGWREVDDPADLDPRAVMPEVGEVDDDTWERYQAALAELRKARGELEAAVRPVSLTEEEAAAAASAYDAEQARIAAWVAEFHRTEDADSGPHVCEYRGNDALCVHCGQ